MYKIRALFVALVMFVAVAVGSVAHAGTAQYKTNCYNGSNGDVCMTVTYQSANNGQGWSVGRIDMSCNQNNSLGYHSPNIKGDYVTIYNGSNVTKWTQTSGISFDCNTGVSFFPSVYAPDANQLNIVYSGSQNLAVYPDNPFKVKVVLQH